MAVTPARPPEPATAAPPRPTAAAASSEAAAAPPAVPARQGWLPHHLKSQAHAAHWIALTHRALPQAALGLRAGALVPPRGSVLSHHAAAADHAPGKAASVRLLRGGVRGDSDADGVGMAEGDIARNRVADEARLAVGAAGQPGSDMGSGADGEESASLVRLRRALGGDGADGLPAASGPDAAGQGTAVSETPAQMAARLRAGETCWVTSLRLAMACARCHPGTDIFVQAFNIVDGDGCVVSAFSRRARLQASAEGQVQVRSDGAHAGAADAELLQALDEAALLSMSLRPVLDESGDPASSLRDLRPAELPQLRRLFERLLPAGVRDALCASAEMQAERWRQARERADFGERMARHGDALERELNDLRARVSSTIDAGDPNAHRAHANWLRAQAQVMHWADRGELPTWPALARINLLLGEGLKPWNRPEQADRVGARFGELRRVDVVAGTPPQYFLRADQLREGIDDLFAWYAEQRRFGTPWLLVAAQMHQRLVTLHPFADANGRTARLVLDWLMALAGMPPPLLKRADLALFAHESEARQAAPGLAEKGLLEGAIASVDMHLQWLGLDGQPE